MLKLIQTDAAINRGNSGGPLVNSKGQVVTIYTVNMPYSQGIAFAVSVNTAKSILQGLIEKKQGYQAADRNRVRKITSQLARYYALPATEGAIIAQVEPYSPPERRRPEKG